MADEMQSQWMKARFVLCLELCFVFNYALFLCVVFCGIIARSFLLLCFYVWFVLCVVCNKLRFGFN